MVGASIGCYINELFPPENMHWALKALIVCVIFPSLIFGVALLRGGAQ